MPKAIHSRKAATMAKRATSTSIYAPRSNPQHPSKMRRRDQLAISRLYQAATLAATAHA